MYWRLSGFYLCYFALLGGFLPYWTLYLSTVGFTPAQIGELMALTMATKIISPNIWAWLADRTGKRMAIVRMASLFAALCFAGVFWARGYAGYALVMLGVSFFWNATLPQFEATTLSHLGDHIHRYGRIRLWGSIGFIVSVIVLGSVLDRYGAQQLPAILLILFGGIWLSSLMVREPVESNGIASSGPLVNVLKRPQVFALLIVCFFMQASHGPYYTFYTIYLEQHGYARSLIGQLWALGVMAEVVLFLVLPGLIARFGLGNLLLASLGLAAVRWLLLGLFANSLAMLILIQLLHAATFGIFHGVAIQLIHRHFVGTHQSRGQALYSSLSFGAGGALGALYSGYAWSSLGATAMYMIAAGMSLTALLIAWRAAHNIAS